MCASSLDSKISDSVEKKWNTTLCHLKMSAEIESKGGMSDRSVKDNMMACQPSRSAMSSQRAP